MNNCTYELNRIPQQSYYLAWRNMSLQNEYAVIVYSKRMQKHYNSSLLSISSLLYSKTFEATQYIYVRYIMAACKFSGVGLILILKDTFWNGKFQLSYFI